jgi:hypothetical protein
MGSARRFSVSATIAREMPTIKMTKNRVPKMTICRALKDLGFVLSSKEMEEALVVSNDALIGGGVIIGFALANGGSCKTVVCWGTGTLQDTFKMAFLSFGFSI